MGQPLSVEIRIAARQESLVFRPVGVSVDALIIEATRQLDFVAVPHFKQVRFPVVAELCVTINGGSENCRSVKARNIHTLIVRAKIILEGMLKYAE